MLRARLCKEEPIPGFGQGVLCQEIYYAVTFVVCRHIFHCILIELFCRVCFLGGETPQVLPFLSKAHPLWAKSWGERLSVTRLFGNAGGVSVCIAAGALYLLIFPCRQMLQSISVLGKGWCGGRVRPEGSWV